MTPDVGPDCSKLSPGDSWLVGSLLTQPIGLEPSRLLGRSDKGLDNFEGKTEAALEEEFTKEVFETTDELNGVRKYSEGDVDWRFLWN